MKVFATFGQVGDDFELIAGPDADYEGQSKLVKELVLKGGKYDHVRLVDVKGGTLKRRRIRKAAPATKKAPAKKAAE